MSQPFRLEQGGRVDRSRPLHFRFDGRPYIGFAGDTLASALLANGVRVTGRSFKYHRARGLFGAGFEEPNTLVQLETGARTEANLKATQIELYDGLVARSVNAWPSAKFDLMAVFRHFKPLMPSGFYYKTFIAPNWHWYEWLIRAAAGLGVSPRQPDPDRYDKQFRTAEVLIIGAGPAGLRAAIEQADAGHQVLLVDDQPEPGGCLLHQAQEIDGLPAQRWLDAQLSRLSAMDNVTLLPRCTAFGYYDHNEIQAVQLLPEGPVRQRLLHIRAGQVILATGAIERPLVFPNNDRPGILLAGAARRYLRQYGVLPGRRLVIATNNDSAYAVAHELRDAGAEVLAILDMRATSPAQAAAVAAGFEVRAGVAPTGTWGRPVLSRVRWHGVTEAGQARPQDTGEIACDGLLVSGGWNPTVHLLSQSGGGLRFDERLQAFVPNRSVQAECSVGAANGDFNEELAVAPLQAIDVSTLGETPNYSWVDLASDVTEGDIRLAAQENFSAVEHLKRYTTTGMMTDQGKTSNVNAIGVLAGLAGKPPGAVGTTKFRPPFNPVSFGALVGRQVGAFYRPLRRLPSDALQRQAGAVMEDYGGWARAACFLRDGEREEHAVVREVTTVRNGVGILDYSPLGKILVHGPDAGEFLNRIYVNNLRTLQVGKCRYGLMLNEHGIIIDDGIATRWDENTFQVGTTSGQAEHVTELLEEWLQCEWLDLDVIVEPVTTQWSTIMVAGPRSRAVLQRLGLDIDLSPAAFGHMEARQGHLGEVPVRIARVSFTGELGFEISVPWSFGASLWQRLLALGRPEGIIPFGIESLMVMRTEKGFLHVGSDTDGATMPQDVGFGPIMDRKSEDFVGRRSTITPEGRRSNRKQLVGLEALDTTVTLPVGGHVLSESSGPASKLSQGWVTSVANSPTLGRSVALALIEKGPQRHGETVRVYDNGRSVPARICAPGFYDPQGERLHVE